MSLAQLKAIRLGSGSLRNFTLDFWTRPMLESSIRTHFNQLRNSDHLLRKEGIENLSENVRSLLTPQPSFSPFFPSLPLVPHLNSGPPPSLP